MPYVSYKIVLSLAANGTHNVLQENTITPLNQITEINYSHVYHNILICDSFVDAANGRYKEGIVSDFGIFMDNKDIL